MKYFGNAVEYSIKKEEEERENTDSLQNEAADAKEETVIVEEAETIENHSNAMGTVATGTCGENLTWSLDEEGNLTISGTGEMEGYYHNSEYGPLPFFRTYNIKRVIITYGVSSIGSYAFRDCRSLESVTIPNSVTLIGPAAFEGCSSLTSVTIPNGVKSIQPELFAGCISLTSVTIPNSVTAIGRSAFNGCSSLKSVTIPNSVKTIYMDAFSSCKSLTCVTIPSSVTRIGEVAFTWCDNLTTIIFDGNAPKFDSDVFFHVTATAYYPAYNTTWTDEVKQNCGGTITWVEYEGNLSDCTINISPSSYTYDGTAKKPTITLRYNGKVLVNNTDYTVSYSNNTNAGTGTVKMTGKGNFIGTVSKTFTINKATPTLSFASSSVSKKTTDSAFTNTLTKKTDGTVTFKSSNTSVAAVNSSTGQVTIKGAGTTTITATATAGTNYNAGTASYTLTVTTNTIDLSNLTYSFGNYWDYFGYSGSYRIPIERYKLFFNRTRAEYLYMHLGKWRGNCYGMSATSGILNTSGSGVSITGFKSSAKMLSDLAVSNKNSSIGMTLTEFIEALQVSQYVDAVQYAYNNNTSLSELCQEVNKVKSGKPPVVLGVMKQVGQNIWDGHAILGYKIEKINNSKSLLYVYDCNYPGQQRYIELRTNAAGAYTGWEYYMNDVEHFKSGTSLYKIVYIPYSLYQGAWASRNQGQSTNILSINSDSFDICDYQGNVVASMSNGDFYSTTSDVYYCSTVDENLDTHLIYMPPRVYQIVNHDSGISELSVSSANEEQSVAVTTTSNSVVLAVDDESETNLVSVDTSEGERYRVVLSSDLESAKGKEEVEYEGEGNGSTITVGMSSGNCILTNCTGISMWINGELVGTTSDNQQIDISKKTVSLATTTCLYDGKNKEPAVTVKDGNTVLKNGTDYVVIYDNNINMGTATATVYGIDKYKGKITKTFKILPAASSKVTCTNVASGIKVNWNKVEGATSYYVYRDDKFIFKTSALVVTDKDVKYNSGTKYVYKVVATTKGIGDSPKARTATMYRLMPVGIKSLTNPSAGKMTVAYDKANGSSGYVVRFGLKSDMSDAKVITVSGQNTLSRTFSGMKKGKTYYVQVRTYKIENGVRYYSGYCTTKKITIQK